MELNEYQKKAMSFCMESSNNGAYMFLNLIGEVGELVEKVVQMVQISGGVPEYLCREMKTTGLFAKNVRKMPEHKDTKYLLKCYSPLQQLKEQEREELSKELGDILWQISGMCTVLDLSLEEVAQQNIDKLTSRQQRNVIDGDGDNR